MPQSFVGFTGIAHSDEPETTGAARIPISQECDLFNRAMRLEDISHLRFGCAVEQIPHVKVLHRNSSLRKSSRLVASQFVSTVARQNLVAERAAYTSLGCVRWMGKSLREPKLLNTLPIESSNRVPDL